MRFGKRSYMLACAALAMPALMCAQVHHYEYVGSPGHIDVYDIDNSFVAVKSIPVPTSAGPLGFVASAATGMLYISYGSNGASGGSLLKYDLVTDQMVWTMTYPFGIDNMSISPDGKTIYMPTGENNPGGFWKIIDAASGSVTGLIDSGGKGPHNTMLNATGSHVYMGGTGYNYLVEADAATHAILQRIGPVTTLGNPGVRPFTINSAETLAFMTATGVLGFQIGDIGSGKILFTVPIQGFSCPNCSDPHPSHGISISPDEKEIYVRDGPNSYVHVYDISGLPGSAPKQVADIPMVVKSRGPGWLHHSRDGHYVFVGDSGDVIDTTTRTTVAALPALAVTARSIEIDFQNGVPVWAMQNRSSAGTVTPPRANVDTLTFHGDRGRTGWQPRETILTPQSISNGNFGPIWNSPAFDSFENNAAHAYASPLYMNVVTMSSGVYVGGTFSVLLVATSNNFVYAVNAFTTTVGSSQVPAGTILWSRSLGTPAINLNMDRVPLGILSTPVVDPSTTPARIYVESADATAGHQVFALDITSGNILPGWPLAINDGSLAPLNQNGPAVFQGVSAMSQRGALNLSYDGSTLYVPFGGYIDSGVGWLVTIDTKTAALLSAFSGAPSTVATANGGIWASSGVAVDSMGNVFSTTGNGSISNETTPGYWGNSLLAWKPSTALSLRGTYTPFNYCQMDQSDTDLGGGGATLLPSLADTGTSTPNLIAFGGKQGNIYLVDKDHLPGTLTARQGCGVDASLDRSLLPPDIQPQFGTAGPLNVYGPYSETNNTFDYAKARTTPAFWRAADGTPYLFVTGSNKASAVSTSSVPPGVYRLKIAATPGQPAYLQVDGSENTLTLLTPGSPVVTSNGSNNAIVWVLVANIPRSQVLDTTSQPFLVALDALTLQNLYQSKPGELFAGGKYNTPVIARGTVFVATDRIQAFGLTGAAPPPPPPDLPVINSFAAAPASINSGQSSVLSWDVTGAAGLSITGIGNVSPLTTGALSVSPGNTRTYTLIAANASGRVVSSATVAVNLGPPGTISVSACSGGAGGGFLSPGGNPGISVSGGHCSVEAKTPTLTGIATAAPLAVYQNKLTGDVNGTVGDFTFTFGPPAIVPGQLYKIRGHFADDLSGVVGQRVFDILANATIVFSGFDIVAAGGSINSSLNTVKPVVKDFDLVVSPDANGRIVVLSRHIKGNPLINAIQLIPNSGSGLPAVSGFNPISGPVGASVTISGRGFSGATGVAINGVAATFTVNSDVKITAAVPANATSGLVSVTNSIGTDSSSTIFTVTSPPPAIISLTANPTVITSGQSTSLSWAVTGTVTSLSINQGIGTVTGTSKSVSPITTTTYTLTASNSGGSATKTVTVAVTSLPPPPPPVINSFSATPSQITAAQSSTLAWRLTGTVTSLTIDQGIGSVAGLSSQRVSPATNITYTLTATNATGSVTKSVTVQVTPLPLAVLPFAMNACGPNVANFVAEVAAYTAGGNCTNIGSPSVVITGVANAAPPGVYQTKRTGQNGGGFTYTIQLPTPVVSGQLYTVRLHLADDLSTATGQRVFNVGVNGNVVLPNLDIFAITGQKMRALVKDVLNVTPNTKNQIVIQGLYVNSGQNPLMNGLEIIPQP